MNYLEEWRFLQPMMFLKDSLAPRRTRDNWIYDENDVVLCQTTLSEDSSNSPTSLTPPTSLNVPTSTTPPPPKKAKTTLDSLCQKFGETIENIEKSMLSPPEQTTTNEAFMKTVVCLMKDLPVAIKDKFQSEMFQELYRLRTEHRNGE